MITGGNARQSRRYSGYKTFTISPWHGQRPCCVFVGGMSVVPARSWWLSVAWLALSWGHMKRGDEQGLFQALKSMS